VLEIESGDILKKIYIKNGDMVFSSSNQEADRLGDILLEEGRITKEQFDQSAQLIKKTGKRQGTILVELGFIKPEELVWAVKYQVEKIILSLFSLKDGEFYFREGPLPHEEVITLSLSAANLIYRGIKDIKDLDYLQSLFPPTEAVLSFSPDPSDIFQDIKLDDTDRRILSLVDGKSTIKQILPLSPLDEFKTLKTLSALLSTRIIVDMEEFKPLLEPEVEHGVRPSVDDIGEQTIDTEVSEEVINRINDMYKRHKSLGYYGVLGLQEYSSDDEIKKAYYRMAKEFHPDRHFHLSGDMKDKLNEIFSYITKAYSTLTDPQKRKEYDRKSTLITTKKTKIAHDSYIDGRTEFRRGNYEEAARLFGIAANLDSSVAKYHYHYCLALLKLQRFKEAEGAILTAIKIDPFNPEYQVELGNLYLELGFPIRATRYFEDALKIDPTNKKAKEGMAKLPR